MVVLAHLSCDNGHKICKRSAIKLNYSLNQLIIIIIYETLVSNARLGESENIINPKTHNQPMEGRKENIVGDKKERAE